MSDGPVDPRWSRLVSLAAHELRTPLTVVSGYIRMLLKDRAGPLSDQQRRLLEEAEKSCGRLSGLVAEMSDLSNLEDGTATFNRSTVALRPLLAEAVSILPPLSDRDVKVELATSSEARVDADPVRLKTALASIFAALRRELLTSDLLLVNESSRRHDDERMVSWIAIGGSERIDQLARADAASLTTFDEWRGGSGLSLAIARRIIGAHGGRVWSPIENTKAGAVIMLPHA